ncbi:MAG: hypothetical protein CL878_14875, partial [Dehalococcoidia bacterium]|nr:hypothetical protein [Dehalococcoidia bacterium]
MRWSTIQLRLVLFALAVRDLWRDLRAAVRAGWQYLGAPPSPSGPGARTFRPAGEASALETALIPFALRLRLTRSVASFPRSLAWASGLTLGPALVARLIAGPLPASAVLALVAAPLFVVLWLRLVLRPVTVLEAARACDLRLRLRERLATAVELLEVGAGGPVATLQLADAQHAMVGLQPAQAFPWHVEQRHLIATGVLVLMAGLLVVWPAATAPSLNSDLLALADPLDPDRQSADQNSDLIPGDSLGGLTGPPQEAGEIEQGLDAGSEGGALGAPDETVSEETLAQAQLSAQEAADTLAEEVGARRQALQTLGQALRRTPAARTAGTMLLREDYEAAAVEMVGLSDSVPDLSDADRDSLSEALSSASQQMGTHDPTVADTTRRAADALRQYRDLTASLALRELAQQTAQTGQLSQEQQQLAQRAEQLRNDQAVGLPGESVQPAGSQQGDRRPIPEVGDPSEGLGNGDQADAGNSLQELGNGEPQGGQGGQGNQTGSTAGQTPGRRDQALPHRLNVTAVRVQVDAQVGEGRTIWRPPQPDSTRVRGSSVGQRPRSHLEEAVTRAWDPNIASAISGTLEDALRRYFSP